jgi:hypothetical protein
VLSLGEVGEPHRPLVEPLLPGRARRDALLDLGVRDDAALGRVDDEHRSGLKTPAARYALRRQVEDARLGSCDHESVRRQGPAPGAQAVAVEGRDDLGAVRREDRGGSVPGLHLARVVVVERAHVRVEARLLLVRLGDHHHEHVRQAAAGQLQHLEHLVERGRVALGVGADRKERLHVAEQLARELRLTRTHPVAIAADGVDLAVVRHHAQRLGERPGRKRVGRVAGVDDREFAREAFVLKIEVEGLQLERRDHALIADGAGGHRDEVCAGLVLGALAQAIGAAVECHATERGDMAGLRARDEQLFEGGEGLVCEASEVGLIDRHLAPSEHVEVLNGGDAFDLPLLLLPRHAIGREECDAGRVLADGRKFEGEHLSEEAIGHLNQDARSVTGSRVGTDRAAVLEIAKGFERQSDDVVSRFAAQRGDHGQTAGVLLETGVVHALLRRISPAGTIGRLEVHQTSFTRGYGRPPGGIPGGRSPRSAAGSVSSQRGRGTQDACCGDGSTISSAPAGSLTSTNSSSELMSLTLRRCFAV